MPEKTTQFPSIKDVPVSKWQKLAQKKIFFGHMSVGYNILDGVRDIMKENPQVKLNIVETTDKADFKIAIFAHSKVGKNYDPQSKIDAFKDVLEGIAIRVLLNDKTPLQGAAHIAFDMIM